jgi:tetratricopeptide (TPR) repeat protein
MKTKAVLCLLVLFCLSVILLFSQGKPSSPPARPRKPASSTTSTIALEDKLHIRLQFHPQDAASHKQLIDILKKRYAFRAIVTEDARWLRNNPNDFLALIELTSYSKAALNDPEFAIAQLRAYLGRVSRDEDPESYDNFTDQLAGELERRGRTDEALLLFAELVRLNPNEAGFWADYGDALSLLGRHSEALKALHHAIEMDPSEESLHQALAEALLNAGDLKGAETEYRAALSLYEAQKREPTDARQSFMSELAKGQAERHEEGYLAELHLKLAHILLLEKKYDEAVAQTKSALDADQYQFTAFYLRAQVYEANGDANAARKARDDAIAAIGKQATKEKLSGKERSEIDPRVLFLNDTLWNKESGYPAFPLEIVSILEPRIASLSTAERVALSSSYLALGRVNAAKEQWERAIAADPAADNAAGHANLGRELLKAGAVSEALPHLQRAYELDPQNVTYRTDYEMMREKVQKH